MERLTHIDHLGWYANGHGGERMRGSHIDRLAAYEDTGIDPDELRIIGDIKRFKYEIIFGSKADRLKELSDADNAGRLIVLPCVSGAELERNGYTFRADHWNHYLTAFRDAPENKSGKQIELFSISEVEAALAGKGGEEHRENRPD